MGTSIDIISWSSLCSGRFFVFPQLEAMKAAFNTPESTGKWARYEFALSTSRRALFPSWHCNARIKSAETQCLVRDACSMDLSSLAMLAVRLLSLDEFWQSFVVGTSNQCNEECRAVWYGIFLSFWLSWWLQPVLGAGLSNIFVFIFRCNKCGRISACFGRQFWHPNCGNELFVHSTLFTPLVSLS